MISMSDEAWNIFILTLRLCCFLCLCSFAFFVEFKTSHYGYNLYHTAVALNEISQSLFLIGVLGSVLIEAAQS